MPLQLSSGPKAGLAVFVLSVSMAGVALSLHNFTQVLSARKPDSAALAQAPSPVVDRPVTAQSAYRPATMLRQTAGDEPVVEATRMDAPPQAPPLTASVAPKKRVVIVEPGMTVEAAPLVQKLAQEAPIVAKETPVEAGMPPDVSEWLKKLHEVETARRTLATSQIGGLLTTFAELLAGPVQQAVDDEDGVNAAAAQNRLRLVVQRAYAMRGEWAKLDSDLHSIPVPSACAAVDEAYTRSLRATADMVTEVAEVCLRATQNPQGALSEAQGMSGTSNRRVDEPAREAEARLGELFRFYKTERWFDIKGDIGFSLWGG